MTMKNVSENGAGSALVKIHEILVVWWLFLLSWHWIFVNFFDCLVNVEYLQWVATAASIIWISKYILARANSSFSSFLGAPLHRRDLPEFTAVFLFSVVLGIGCLAGSVLATAKLDAEWAYLHWGITSPENFDVLTWLPQWMFLHLISGAVVVPITEEIIFRGFILGRLLKKQSAKYAIVISSLIFAIFHLDKDPIGSFVLGVVFAVLAVRFASLYAPMLVHGAYNAAVFVLRTRFGVSLSAEKSQISSAAYWLPELFCLGLGIVLLIVYLRYAERSMSVRLNS